MKVTYMQAPVEGSRVSAAGTCPCGEAVWAFGDTKDDAKAAIIANLKLHVGRDHS